MPQPATGEYYVPQAFWHFIATLAEAFPSQRVLDLTWQSDALLDEVSQLQHGNGDYLTVPLLGKTSSTKYQTSRAELLSDYPGLARETFGIVLAMPPFGLRAPEQVMARSSISVSRVDIAVVYAEWATWFLQPGGVLLLTVPGPLLSTHSSQPFRDYLMSRLELLGVFELGASAIEAQISSAVMVFRRPAELNRIKSQTFMADIRDWEGLPQVVQLFQFVMAETKHTSQVQLALARIGSSSAFTSNVKGILSPVRLFFQQNVLEKLRRFPTVQLGEVAEIRVGIARNHLTANNGFAVENFVTARQIARDGKISGFSKYSVTSQRDLGSFETLRLRSGDVLVRATQTFPKQVLEQSTLQDPGFGFVAGVVTPQMEGSLFDNSLIRIRIKDDAPQGMSSEYLVSLLRNQYAVSAFNDLVIDQVVGSASKLSTAVRLLPIVFQQLHIPLLPLSAQTNIGDTNIIGFAQLAAQLETLTAKVVQGFESVKEQIVQLGTKLHLSMHDEIAGLQGVWQEKLRSAPTDEQERLTEERNVQIHEFIKRKMQDKAKVIDEQRQRLETYVFGPFWGELQPNARLYLATGEFFYDYSRDMNDSPPDYSGVAVEFCKAVEVELAYRVGTRLAPLLASNGIGQFPFWSTKNSKYKDLVAINKLADGTATLGTYEGFLWGIAKRTYPAAPVKYKEAAERIYAVVAKHYTELSLFEETGIPAVLTELIRHRNGSAHRDLLLRNTLEELHSLVISFQPQDSIIVQIVQALPLA